MANSINWGKVLCEMDTDSAWGDKAFSTFSILDTAQAVCWDVFGLTADLTEISGDPFTADDTIFTADATQQ